MQHVAPECAFAHRSQGLGKEVAVCAATFIALLLPTVSCSAVLAQLTGGTQKAFLQGGVDHCEQLAPVQSALKVGTVLVPVQQ